MEYSLYDVNSNLNQIMIEFTKRENKIKELQHEIQELQTLFNNEIERKSVNESLVNTSPDYTYSIDKNTFVKCINSIRDFMQYMNKLSDVNINLFEEDSVNELIDNFSTLISNACNDMDTSRVGTELDYFMWDLDFGKKWTEASLRDEYHNPIDISTTEKFWDYIYNYYIKDCK